MPTANTFGSVNTGQTFVAGGASLSLSVTPTTFGENAGANAATATITRTGDLTNAVNVTVSSNDTTEAAVPSVVVIPAGQASAVFPVDAIDDTITDGPQIVTLMASASGFASITTDVTVTDNDVEAGPLRIHDIQGAAHRSPLQVKQWSTFPGS